MSEEWRKIKNYEDYYISDKGRVKSIKNNKERLLSLNTKDSYGYIRVCLCKNGIPKYFNVHRLVAEAFIEKPDINERIVVNHIDKNILNNDVNNLEWCTYSYNANHSIEEIIKGHTKERKPIIRIDENNNEVIYIGLREAAKINKLSRCEIRKSITTNKKYKGYMWKFVNAKDYTNIKYKRKRKMIIDFVNNKIVYN